MITYLWSHSPGDWSPPCFNYPVRLWYQESWQWHLTPWREDPPPGHILGSSWHWHWHRKVMRDGSDSDTGSGGIEQPRVTHWASDSLLLRAALPTPAPCPVSTPPSGSRPLPGSGQALAPMAGPDTGTGLAWTETRGRGSSLLTRHSPMLRPSVVPTPRVVTHSCHVTPAWSPMSRMTEACQWGDWLWRRRQSPLQWQDRRVLKKWVWWWWVWKWQQIVFICVQSQDPYTRLSPRLCPGQA